MSKFKVGDQVVGNAEASARYNITREGWKGKVTQIEDADHFRAVAVLGSACAGVNFQLEFDYFDLVERPCQKIVVTTDGKTTTARLFSGKELVKSSEAKCSPKDEFDFKIGAGIAVSRLLNTEDEKPEAPQFTKADLKDGMFCRLSDGSWFVIVGDLAVCDDGEWVSMSELREDLTWEVAGNIEVVLEGISCFNSARMTLPGSRNVVWVRPGVKFE